METTRHGTGLVAGLTAVCAVAVARLPVDAAAVSLHTADETRGEDLLATTHPWARELEELQYELGEGPGVDAFTTGEIVLGVPVGRRQDRWPMFAAAAADRRVGWVSAIALQTGAIRVGVLDLYTRTTRTAPDRELSVFTPGEVADTHTLARLATTIILREAQTAQAVGRELSAPDHYDTVHVATGMLSVQLRTNLSDAFARLCAYAYAENTPLLDVASDIIAHRIRLDQSLD